VGLTKVYDTGMKEMLELESDCIFPKKIDIERISKRTRWNYPLAFHCTGSLVL
jgi:hypothetical protein